MASPSLRVRFGDIDVQASVRSAGTLLLHTPAHDIGPVTVRVSNDLRSWSESQATFTFEASNERDVKDEPSGEQAAVDPFGGIAGELFDSMSPAVFDEQIDDAFIDSVFGAAFGDEGAGSGGLFEALDDAPPPPPPASRSENKGAPPSLPATSIVPMFGTKTASRTALMSS